jgi:hypothetical protein
MKIVNKNRVVNFLGVLAIYGGTAIAQPQDQAAQGIPPDAAGGTLQRGVPASNLPSHAGHQAAGANNLIDHGGLILPASKIYYIWWGNSSGWPSDASAGLTAFADGLNGSNFLSSNDIFPQYMRNASTPSTAYVTSIYDSSTPPKHGPGTSTIVNEVCKVLSGQTPDPTAVYVVLTSNFPRGANYCAWHSWGTCNGKTIQVAYLPNTTGVAGCDPGNLYSCNGYSQGTRSIANVLSHEFSEAITDANGNAWYDSSGSEIGDKCAWQFSSCVGLKTGNWQLQEEWSNKVSGCAQQ